MKKFTLLILVAFSSLLTYAGVPLKAARYTEGPVKKAQLAAPVKKNNVTPVNGVTYLETKGTASFAAQSPRNKSPKKAISSVSELAGSYTWNYSMSSTLAEDATTVEATDYQANVTIAVTDESTGEISISGMFPNTLTATVDLTNGRITIPSQTAGTHSTYGAYELWGVFYYEGDDTHQAGWYYNSSNVGFIQSDGSILFATNLWMVRRLTEGDNAGKLLTPYYLPGSTLTPQASSEPGDDNDDDNTLVTLPSGVTATEWAVDQTLSKLYIYGSNGYQDYTSRVKTLNVAISGNDVYIQGLAYYFDTAWVKGTLSGNKVTFPAITFVGEDQYGKECMIGSADQGASPSEWTMTYDATEKKLTLDSDFLLFEADEDVSNGIRSYGYWGSIVISEGAAELPKPVELPEGAELKEYSLSYETSTGAPGSAAAAVAVVGNDVYFQGFSSYIPEALIKGTKSGNTVTFPAMQYLGSYAGLDSYLYVAATFTYDEAKDTYTSTDQVYSVLGDQYYDVNYYNPVLKGVVEKATMPANPAITGLENGQYGYYITFNVPNVDVNGDGLVASKLSYEIFTDVERDVQPLTFTPTTHTRLTENMTVIPFGFSEGYDFYDGQIYLNELYSEDWNKLGIKSIYTGGGETNETEIQWFDIKDYTTADDNLDELATLPEGVEAEDWTLEGENGQGELAEGTTAQVAFDGDDVYVGGLFGNWAPDAIIKGKKSGNTVTFPAGRLIADAGGFKAYAIGTDETLTNVEDIVFTYAETDNETSLTQVTDLIVMGGSQTEVGYPYYYLKNAKISKSTAAQPAQDEYYVWIPSEKGYTNAQDLGKEVIADGYTINFSSGTNTQNSPKYYDNGTNARVYKDNVFSVAGKNIYKVVITYTPTYPGVLSTTLPTLTQNADENTWTWEGEKTDLVEFSNAQKTNVQLRITKVEVYVKGDAPSEPTSTPATPSTPVIDEVLSDTGLVSLAFTIPTTGTNGETLDTSLLSYKLYAEGENGEPEAITLSSEIYQENGIALDEDLTEIPYDLAIDGVIYTPEGEYGHEILVITGKNLPKIGVQAIYRGGDEEHASEIAWSSELEYPVELPEGLQPELYTWESTLAFSGSALDWDSEVNIAFDNNDVYLQGLCLYYPEAWVKGTVSNGKIVVPNGQFITYDESENSTTGEKELVPIYLVGANATTAEVEDIEFTYDAQNNELMREGYIIVSGSKGLTNMYLYTYHNVIYKGEKQEDELVELPTGVLPETYVYTATRNDYSSSGTVTTNIVSNVQIGFDGRDVYVKGLEERLLPDAWVKGRLDNGKLIIPSRQYIGTYSDYTIYLLGTDKDENNKDLVFNISDDNKTITLDPSTVMYASGNKYFLNWFHYYNDVELSKLVEVAAVPQAPSEPKLTNSQYGWYAMFDIAPLSVDGEALNIEKLSYLLYTDVEGDEQPLTLKASDYENFDEDLDVIPWQLDDDYDIFHSGNTHYVYLYNDDIESWNRFGVQAIYHGGNAINSSEITWLKLKEYTGIATVNAEKTSSAVYTLNGTKVRNAGESMKGLQKGVYVVGNRKVVIK